MKLEKSNFQKDKLTKNFRFLYRQNIRKQSQFFKRKKMVMKPDLIFSLLFN